MAQQFCFEIYWPLTLREMGCQKQRCCFVLKKLYQMVNIGCKLFSAASKKNRVIQKCFINIFWQNAGVWNKIQKGFHSNMPKLSEWNRGPIIKWSCYQGPLEFVSSNLQASKKNPFFCYPLKVHKSSLVKNDVNIFSENLTQSLS